MSVKVQTWVWDHSKSSGNDRLVLLKIADEADHDGTNTFPSMKTLARTTRVNERTIMRSVKRLEEMGELLVRRPDKYGAGHHNYYVVLMGRPASEVAEALDWPYTPPEVAEEIPVSPSPDEVVQTASASDPGTDERSEKGDSLSPFQERAGQTVNSRPPREKGDSLSGSSRDKAAQDRAQVSPNPVDPPLIDKTSTELLTTRSVDISSDNGTEPVHDANRSEQGALPPKAKIEEIMRRHGIDPAAEIDDVADAASDPVSTGRVPAAASA